MNKSKILIAKPSGQLKGKLQVPGDKSISHRALILATVANGVSKIQNLLEGEDVMATKDAMSQFGAKITENTENTSNKAEYMVAGVGNGGLLKPTKPLDFKNAGTGSRLTMGLVASYDFETSFVGDESLSSRPMGRVINPLKEMGLQVENDRDKLPITIKGVEYPMAITHKLEVPSAQVKSAILLAGLNTAGITSVIETIHTRDHTEKMLEGFGAEINIEKKNGERHIAIRGQTELSAQDINVPGDPSSAAFPIVAALIVPDSEITIENVLVNPTRIGLYDTLKEMGGDIQFFNQRKQGGEDVADIRVKSSKLKGIKVEATRAPMMIDEYPVLAVAAAFAEGPSEFLGIEELRVKECDRLAVTAQSLLANGIECTEGEDYLLVQGTLAPERNQQSTGKPKGGGQVQTHLDHRIAMSFLILGLGCQKPIRIDDANVINTSFPNFQNLMAGLGAKFE